MKAVRIHEYGGPEVLKLEDIAAPVPKANEVLLRVKACALNHLDLWIRQGMPKVKTLPHILGSDISGEVVEVGELCWRVKPGQRVLLSPGVSCRQCEYCVSGHGQSMPPIHVVRKRRSGRQSRIYDRPRVRRHSHSRQPQF